jgi:predicted acylesterase/phospholipase RssA
MRQTTRHKGRTIGLALGGGGARGLAHIGVLKALDREKIPIHIIAGTSIGALVGAAFASGIHPEDMEKRVESYLQSEKFQTSAIKAVETAHAKGELTLGPRAQAHSLFFKIKLLDLGKEFRPADLQDLGRLSVVASRAFKGLLDKISFHPF